MTGDSRRDLIPYAMQQADALGVPRNIAYALFETENGWDNGASTDGNGYGMGQISFETANKRGWNVYDDEENIRDSLTYLKEQYDKYGDWNLAYGGYNGWASYDNEHVSTFMGYQGEYDNYIANNGEIADDVTEATRPLTFQDGVLDTNLDHTDRAVYQNVVLLNQYAYDTYGKDMVVSGGWRDEATNATNNGTPNSKHLSGLAVDFNMDAFTPEEREDIMARAEAQGFTAIWHDAGSGLHLHLQVADPSELAYSPSMEDYLPAEVADPNIMSYGAQPTTPWYLTKEELLGAYNIYASDYWKEVQEPGEPGVLEAMWHGFTGGNNWVYNFLNALNADIFHSENSLTPWEASKEDIDAATEKLFGDKQEAERIASISRDATQFQYYLQQRHDWLEEDRRFRDYYSGIGANTVGELVAAIADPLNLVSGAGIIAKGAKAVTALKMIKRLGGAVKDVDAIKDVAGVATQIAEKEIKASRTAANAGIRNAILGTAKPIAKAAFDGAVSNLAQEYLVTKAQHKDTNLEQAALMGGIAGGVLSLIGKSTGRGLHAISERYAKRTKAMRDAAERVEYGSLQEAAGMSSNYKVRMEALIEKMAKASDPEYFKGFKEAIQNITKNNRVFAVTRKEAQGIAREAGIQLPDTARAFFDPNTRSTFILKEAVKDEQSLMDLLRHEVGVHQKLKDTIGADTYDSLMKMIDTERLNNPKSVWAQAAKHVDSADPEEILGYAIENNMLKGSVEKTLIKSMKQGLKALGLGNKKGGFSNKEILDMVSQSLMADRADKLGVAYHMNDDGSVMLNGLKFSKENLANPNTILDTLEAMGYIPREANRPKNKVLRTILDTLDGKGWLGRVLYTTNFGDAYHSVVPSIKKFAADLWQDEQGRGIERLSTLPPVERMASYWENQLKMHSTKIGDLRNAWLADSYGKSAVVNPHNADVRRMPFNMAVLARFNKEYRGITPTHVDEALLNNPYVVKAAAEMKAYRDAMIELGKRTGKDFGLKKNDMIEEGWEPVDNEWFRVADSDKIGDLYSHVLNEGDKGVHKFLEEYALKFADRDLVKKQLEREIKLHHTEGEELPKVTSAMVEKDIAERAKAWASNTLKNFGERAYDEVDTPNTLGLNFLKKRLPMNTSGEMQLPDGYVWSFDRDLRSYDIDYQMARTMRRFSGEASMKNFLSGHNMTLESWTAQVNKEISSLEHRGITTNRASQLRKDFDDMVKNLRGMSTVADDMNSIGAVARIFKNLAYFKNGSMMGVNQLGDMSSGVAYNGFGTLTSVYRPLMDAFAKAKYGSKEWEELQNMSMMLEGKEIAGKVFNSGFRDNIARNAVVDGSSRVGNWLADAADFTQNLSKVMTGINRLGALTDNQVVYARTQAIADAFQWAQGKKVGLIRNPFSKSKLAELGVPEKNLAEMRKDILKYLDGGKDGEAQKLTASKVSTWRAEKPETFWLFRELINHQVNRAIVSNSRGNANKLMQNSQMRSALMMFKGFSFRASNARFAHALRTGDLDDSLAFGLSLLWEGSIFAARQALKVGGLYAAGNAVEAEKIKKEYLNPETLARAAFLRTAYLSPMSLGNDVGEALTGAPTIRTTVNSTARTQAPSDIGDVAGNIVSQSPVVATFNDSLVRPIQSAYALADGRGSKRDLLNVVHALPVPNVIGATQFVDTLIKTGFASDLPDKRPRRQKATQQQQSQSGIVDKAKQFINSL